MKGALAIIGLLFLAAAALVVAGIGMLAGLPWALIALGVLLFGAAIVLRAGLKPNG